MPSRQPSEPAAAPPELTIATHPLHRHHLLLAPLATALAAASAVLILSALALSFLLLRRLARYRSAPTAPSDVLKPFPPPPLRRFSYSHLRRATSNFSPSRRLGQGGFGPVFRAALPSAPPLAVKLMDSGSLQGEREFHNELALAAALSGSGSPFVVAPIGYSSDRRSRRDRSAAPRLLLVYELMHNGSLQDALLHRRSPELADWAKRFNIAVDVARALHFLHDVCNPPVIHGDIKPSNVLLDSCLSARIADFGLARIKTPGNAQLDEEATVVVDADPIPDDASVMGETAASTTTTWNEEVAAATERSPEEAASTSEASNSRRGGQKKAGKDWWWRQDGSSVAGGSLEHGVTVKDYVMEWIRSEIKERPKSDWITAPAVTAAQPERPDRKKQQRREEWWASLDDEKVVKKETSRLAREWWREEFCEELTNKQKRRMAAETATGAGEAQCCQKDDDSVSTQEGRNKRRRKKSSSHGSRASMDWCMDRLSGEVRTAGRQSSRDWASGDIPQSGTVSSTPSMRGTVCYAAPEYSSGGPLSEKCDIYSFGILLLVLVSGRRPLEITASPLPEFERGNLISWARQVAHLGRLLDLLDPSLQAVNRDQALLCITVALLCIQRSPARRPTIKEIVGMLTGQSEAPHLPLEFSPSPPGGFTFKSRRKAR